MQFMDMIFSFLVFENTTPQPVILRLIFIENIIFMQYILITAPLPPTLPGSSPPTQIYVFFLAHYKTNRHQLSVIPFHTFSHCLFCLQGNNIVFLPN